MPITSHLQVITHKQAETKPKECKYEPNNTYKSIEMFINMFQDTKKRGYNEKSI